MKLIKATFNNCFTLTLNTICLYTTYPLNPLEKSLILYLLALTFLHIFTGKASSTISKI